MLVSHLSTSPCLGIILWKTSVFLDYMGCYNFLMTGYVIYNAEGVNPLVINTLFELPEVKGTFFYLGLFCSVSFFDFFFFF